MGDSFSIGRALSLGFSVWFRNFLPFTLLALVIYAPLILWTVQIGDVFEGGVESMLSRIEELERFDVLSGILGWLLNTLLAATLCYGVVHELRGRHAGFGATVGNGLKRLFPVLGVWILLAVIVGGPLVLLLLMSPFIAILWLVPGIIMWCMYYVAIPVAVMERPGIAGALARSRDLTSGRKGAVFLLVLLLGAIAAGIGWIVKSTVLPEPESLAELDELVQAIPTFLYANLGIDLVFGTLGGVVVAVSYYLLRAEKEGTSADELAAVFE